MIEKIKIADDVSVGISLPTEHQLQDGMVETLRTLLARYPQVSHAYLLQFKYPAGFDPSAGDAACLTCILRIDGDEDSATFDAVSRESQPAIDRYLREWRFLDFFRYSASVSGAIERIGKPFYVRKD